MGQDIDRTDFSAEDYKKFAAKLRLNLSAAKQVLARPGFGVGNRSVGAELELYIIDAEGMPMPINQQLLDDAADTRLTLELNRYNLEANLTPQRLDASPFKRMEEEMEAMLATLNGLAAQYQASVVPIGILPTLQPRHFDRDMMTPCKRYEMLTNELRNRRNDKFHIRLKGEESLSMKTDLVTCEGANTSLQIHYRSSPERFVKLYNTVQLITPLLIGIGCNSPFFLGRRLWHETRIPLFKQSIDGRDRQKRALHMPARVHPGHGWLRNSALELFAEAVYLYEPLVPLCADENPHTMLLQNKLPALHELCLHLGSIWPWNRVVYDPHEEGHVRIEMRSLPAGPSSIDMVANAAFFIGLAEGLYKHIDELIIATPYKYVEKNLYSAARSGMQAKVLWPSIQRMALEQQPLTTVVELLLPIAAHGLQSLGIDATERDRYMQCIRQRVDKRQSGASWQLNQFERLHEKLGRDQALRQMLAHYARQSTQNIPVADWDYR